MNPEEFRQATPAPQSTLPEDEQTAADILRSKLAEYEAAIANLPVAGKINCDQAVMAVLVARDEVARVFSKSQPVPDDLRFDLARVDQILRTRGTVIDERVGSATLARWRETFQPPGSAWWWSLDRLATDSEQKRNVLWIILTGFGVTLAIAFATDISSRFLSGGPDKFGIFSTSAQLFLALLASSSFTQVGREWLGNGLSSFGIKRKFQPLFSLVLTLIVLVGILGFRYTLPGIAKRYNQQGLEYLIENKVTPAMRSFERAVALDPESAEAHYNLGNAYEEVFDYDKALIEYRRAVDINPKFQAGLTNLARLYMVQRSDYQKAIDLISPVFTVPFTSKEIEYAAYKNRGWAFWGLEQFDLSESDLRKALQISDKAEAHCMLGEALGGQGKKEDADDERVRCIELVRTQKDRIEPRWLALAMTGIRK